MQFRIGHGEIGRVRSKYEMKIMKIIIEKKRDGHAEEIAKGTPNILERETMPESQIGRSRS